MLKNNLFWRLKVGTPPGACRMVAPDEMLEFNSFAELGRDHLLWRGHPEFGADFEVEIVLTPRPDGLFSARLAYRNYHGSDFIEEVAFPSYHEPAEEDTLFLLGGHALGHIMEMAYFREENWTREHPFEFCNTCMNLNMILRPDHTGMYLDLRDPVNRQVLVTRAWREKADLYVEFFRVMAMGSKPAESYSMDFDAVIGDFSGSWYEGGQIYREWALKQWWHTRRTKENPLRNIGCWLWNRGPMEHVVPPTLKLQEDLGEAKVALDWYWWHSNPYDTDYPNFWPPREGEAVFKEGVRRCREKGIYTQVYMNGVCWDMDTWNYNEGGSEGVVIMRDGSPHCNAFNTYNHHRLAWRCGTSKKFHEVIREQVKHLHDAGLSGQYLDMIGCATDHACYNPLHDHLPGGGDYLVNGFREMLEGVHADNGPDFAVTTEEPNEKYMDLLDGVITLFTSPERMNQTAHRYSVPLYTSIYHGSRELAVFGNYALPDGIPPWDEKWPAADRWQGEEPWHKLYPYQFQVEFARCIVWGIQPMVCNLTEKIYTDPEFKDIYRFIVEGGRFFYENRAFLFDGRMLNPAGFTTPEHDVDFMCRFIFTKRADFKQVTRKLPKILHGIWESPTGEKALFLVNYTQDSVPWSYRDRKGEMPPYAFRKIPI